MFRSNYSVSLAMLAFLVLVLAVPGFTTTYTYTGTAPPPGPGFPWNDFHLEYWAVDSYPPGADLKSASAVANLPGQDVPGQQFTNSMHDGGEGHQHYVEEWAWDNMINSFYGCTVQVETFNPAYHFTYWYTRTITNPDNTKTTIPSTPGKLTMIPEPSSLVGLVSGVGLLTMALRRRFPLK